MNIGIAEAKAKLSELIERAQKGEEIIIERHGKPIARLTPEQPKKKPLDVEGLKKHLASMPKSDTPAGETVRRMRDDARY